MSYQILASNTPTSYALSSGTLPPGVTLNTTSGLLSGTPTTAGSYAPAFTATNAGGTSSAIAIAFTISPADAGVLIISEPFNYTIFGNNPDPDASSGRADGLPATQVMGQPGSWFSARHTQYHAHHHR